MSYSHLLSRTYKTIIGWGAGNYYRQLVEEGERRSIDLLIDDDAGKWGGRLDGIPVFCPDKLLQFKPEDTLIVVFSGYFYNDIVPRIEARGHHNFLPGLMWVHLQLSILEAALKASHTAKASASNVADLHWRLSRVLRRLDRRWQEVEALETATHLDGRHAQWHFALGEARAAMNRFGQAAEAYATAVALEPSRVVWNYHLGYALEEDGRVQEAHKAYATAIECQVGPVARSCGVGFFHHRMRHRQPAVRAYADQTRRDPLNANLHYRLGKAHARCFHWEQAAEAYRAALKLAPSKARWHYCLGFALERMGAWTKAAAAYTTAVTTLPRPSPDWMYRLGYVLDAAGQHEKACEAFFRAAPLTSHGHASTEEAAGDWQQVAEAYRSDLMRKETHDPQLYHRLGSVLAASGQYQLACDAFKETRILKRPQAIPLRRRCDRVAQYVEYTETLPVRDKVVLYESHAGDSISCNPYAIFRHILDRREFEGWTHVWTLNDKARIPQAYRKMENVVFVSRESDLYCRYLATAKYLVNNNTFEPFFSRREEQAYLNTWHGTPLKTLGRDTRSGFFEHRNAARNFLHATHLISPNTHTSHVLIDRYDIRGVFRGKLAETGYPRIDLTIDTTAERKKEIRELLQLTPESPIVLYAPTWRGSLGKTQFEVTRLTQDAIRLSQLPCNMLFRSHYLAESLIRKQSIDIPIVPAHIDTNELLSIVDILITDYSSIFFDFLPTGRPILHYTYDKEEYHRTRGLYFDMEEMPGEKCDTIDALVDMVAHLLQAKKGWSPSSAYQDARLRFCPYEDGRATQRAVDWFFFDKPTHEIVTQETARPSLLFFQGCWMPNGITTSCLNLFKNLAPGRFQVTLAIDPGLIESYPEYMERFSQIPSHVQVLARGGAMPLTPEEKWVTDAYTANHDLDSPALWHIYRHAFQREFRRLYGTGHFDVLVNYEGYSRYWASLFAFASSNIRRRVIYQHNDMHGEWKLKYPSLAGIFRHYAYYDALISPAETTRDRNRESLSKALGVAPERFISSNYFIDAEFFLQRASEPLASALPERRDTDCKTFITLGRLSPEKDHAKLIRAFGRVHARSPNTALWILGNGPLEHDLQRLIIDMDLADAVHLMGLQSNPFPFVKAADAFILSSNHEGQPLVLLESMILGKPVIATDIPGCRDVLAGGYGLLVKNSEDGLAKGMEQFLESGLNCKPFDHIAHQDEALRTFMRYVCDVAETTEETHHRALRNSSTTATLMPSVERSLS